MQRANTLSNIFPLIHIVIHDNKYDNAKKTTKVNSTPFASIEKAILIIKVVNSARGNDKDNKKSEKYSPFLYLREYLICPG